MYCGRVPSQPPRLVSRQPGPRSPSFSQPRCSIFTRVVSLPRSENLTQERSRATSLIGLTSTWLNRLATWCVIGGMLLSACGAAVAPAASRSPATAAPRVASSPSAEASVPTAADLILADSRYGKILFDGSGRTLYLFGADGGTG